jgi:hypothetical protein
MPQKTTPEKDAKKPRRGWAEKFAQMRQAGHDALLIDDIYQDEKDLFVENTNKPKTRP